MPDVYLGARQRLTVAEIEARDLECQHEWRTWSDSSVGRVRANVGAIQALVDKIRTSGLLRSHHTCRTKQVCNSPPRKQTATRQPDCTGGAKNCHGFTAGKEAPSRPFFIPH